MAGTTSIASRMAQLKRLKQGGAAKQKREMDDIDHGFEADDDALTAFVDTPDCDSHAPPLGKADDGEDANRPSDRDSFTLDEPADDESFASQVALDDAGDTAATFGSTDERHGGDQGDPWTGDASAAFGDRSDEPRDSEVARKPAATFDDFTDAYDAAATEDDAEPMILSEAPQQADLSTDEDDSDLPPLELDDEETFALSDEAAFPDDFDDTAMTEDETASPGQDNESLDADAAFEREEAIGLADEATEGDVESETIPDFAAQEVDELVLAQELEAERGIEEASAAAVSANEDAPEAPFSSENPAGEVAVTFDLQRSRALNDFSRDMNCSVEDIVVTALDWYLDALFGEEEEARSA